MSLLKQLTRWKIRGQIDQDVIDIILTLQSRLEHHWRIDVSIPTVITLLLHIANSLARLKRGGCVSPLHQPFYDGRKLDDVHLVQLFLPRHRHVAGGYARLIARHEIL